MSRRLVALNARRASRVAVVGGRFRRPQGGPPATGAMATWQEQTSSYQNYNYSQRQQQLPISSLLMDPHYISRNEHDRSDHSTTTTTALPVDGSRRSFHTSPPSERAAAIIMGLATVSAVAYAGSSAVQSYNEWKAAQPSPEELKKMQEEQEKEDAQRRVQEEEQEEAEAKKPRQNIFKEWFGVGVGSKYYEGGFEDEMTRKEAALILGVRESSSAQRIKEAHRKLLIL